MRTRHAILEAFVRLLQERRWEAIRVVDIVGEAGIGKATFYEHFQGKNEVLIAAMEPVLLALATAASGRAARSYVKGMAVHLWQQRRIGRGVFDSAAAPLIHRRLAAMIRRNLERANTAGTAPQICAAGIAAAQIAMLRTWLAGEASCRADEMADRLIHCSRLLA